MKVAQSCPTLCNSMGYIVHGILQARILEWIAFPFSGDLPNPGIKSSSPTLQVDSLPTEPPGNAAIKPDFFPSVLPGTDTTIYPGAQVRNLDIIYDLTSFPISNPLLSPLDFTSIIFLESVLFSLTLPLPL